MLEQAKILRVFKLIGLLKNRPRSIRSLAIDLDTTDRTIYRYIKLIEELGFMVDKDWHNQYFIHTTREEEEKNIHFTEVEAVILQELIDSGLMKHPLRESLQKKLFLNSELKKLPDQLVKARLGRLVDQLVTSIDHKSQVILEKYHSGHSGLIRDRLIEPFELSQGFEMVLGYEPESGQNKYFKIERIGRVLELDKEWQHEEKHEKQLSDIFGITGEETIQVELHLSLRAYLLLREEYPKSIPYLQKVEKEEELYMFSGPVNGLKGIGRFVMGLLDEITIMNPPELRKYILEVYSNFVNQPVAKRQRQ